MAKDTAELPKPLSTKPVIRWLASCNEGGSTTPMDDERAANYLVHCRVCATIEEANDLLASNARKGGHIPIKRLPHGPPGKLSFVSPNETPPQHSKRISRREAAA